MHGTVGFGMFAWNYGFYNGFYHVFVGLEGFFSRYFGSIDEPVLGMSMSDAWTARHGDCKLWFHPRQGDTYPDGEHLGLCQEELDILG